MWVRYLGICGLGRRDEVMFQVLRPRVLPVLGMHDASSRKYCVALDEAQRGGGGPR